MRNQPGHPAKIGEPRRHPETGGSLQTLLHEPPALIRHVTQVLHRHNGATEILWGATYRIVMVFLRLIFQFEPPAMGRRPVLTGVLTEDYLLGSS